MEPTRVDDDEALYRSIRANSTEYTQCNGVLRFSASAFNDTTRKPSVDRSSLREDPKHTRKGKTDGVTKVVTRDVRSISKIRVNPNDSEDVRCYAVDAIHRPIVEDMPPVMKNLAHSQIECAPGFSTDTHFKKLKDALALLAGKYGFVVNPESE